MLCGWRGALPHLSPAPQDHPGMASPLTTESETISPSSPAPLACSKRAGGPAPGPFPAHCGFALDAAGNTGPAPSPGSRAGSRPPPTVVSHCRALCPSGTLGHTLYRLPCPHTQSWFGQLTLLHIHRRTHPHPLQFQSLTQRCLKLSPELESPRAQMTMGF